MAAGERLCSLPGLHGHPLKRRLSPDGAWRKARRSVNNGACVEVAGLAEDMRVRDSRNPSGPVLAFTVAEWEAFVGGVRKGEFDTAALVDQHLLPWETSRLLSQAIFDRRTDLSAKRS